MKCPICGEIVFKDDIEVEVHDTEVMIRLACCPISTETWLAAHEFDE